MSDAQAMRDALSQAPRPFTAIDDPDKLSAFVIAYADWFFKVRHPAIETPTASQPVTADVCASHHVADLLRGIIELDQHERTICVEVDSAGNTYEVTKIDGPCAAVARAALSALERQI